MTLVLFGDPLAGRLAGSPKWTFSDSFSVVRLSSVLDRGLTYVLQILKKLQAKGRSRLRDYAVRFVFSFFSNE